MLTCGVFVRILDGLGVENHRYAFSYNDIASLMISLNEQEKEDVREFIKLNSIIVDFSNGEYIFSKKLIELRTK